MFWKKKNTVEFDGLPVILSKREAFNRFSGEITQQFLAYKHGNKWRGLIGYEQFREEVDNVNKKLDLILSHLNLEYVPETEKKEPAKLVQKVRYLGKGMDELIREYAAYHYMPNPSGCPGKKKEPNKKKRGRPKKK